ncbi:tumor necrosis factor receptor superfamily member 6 isoform X3 [Myotis daubentonii]|uniref:tumor necrosis factor receptor superfamily member 6 isoform X3 n=1 Tax=Myotis daubentonii TaxID=98922 RepID=UPI0028731315|nr:tumor necrosis factor receptor superfamily member 6 isoform X3 [Myotis daubentonii]
MPRIGVLLLLILAICTESSTKADNAQVTNTYSELLKLSKNITKRESGCPEGQQREGNFCCRPCPPGERKKDDCKADGDKLVCEPCSEGKEYTDEEHYSPTCRRCGICDGEHGLEVEKNCTKTQNTKCRCKSNYFCNTPPCEHCNPCSTCEHGIIKDCTPTNDTRCKAGSTSHLRLLWLLILVPIAAAFILWRVKRRRRNNNLPPSEPTSPDTEMLPVISSDIDLTDYISTIAELMTISEVRDFVRKNGLKEAKIDEIKNDNLQNTAEQKVQLLRNWYQVHGKKDAFTTLITGLKKIKLCAHADKIKDIVLNDITSKRENTNITNENESQRCKLKIVIN